MENDGDPRKLPRAVAALAAGVLLTLSTTPASQAQQASEDELQRLAPVMDRLQLDYGQRVDDVDARRLADKLEVATGQTVDRADVDRMEQIGTDRIEIADRLLPWFDRFGLDYGTVVDPGDSFNLAQWLGAEVGRAVDPGDVDALEAAARFEQAHPTFATTSGIRLRLVNDQVELIGYHQSNHDGAQQLDPRGDLGVTMEDRGRDTASRGSADVAVPGDTPILSPADGTVIRAGTYTLYCEYRDDFVVIEPDGRPGWEVKILHIDGVLVERGDRIVAGQTLLAHRATVLPFHSQVNDHTKDPDTPHVHVEVVDTSIPDRPSEGGGC